MNIIMMMTQKSKAAVERFSTMMKKVMGTARNMTNLKAFLSAPPFSSCMALRIWAVARIIVPLAISDGWKVKPGICIMRCAPLMFCPAASTHSRVMTENRSRKGVSSLK